MVNHPDSKPHVDNESLDKILEEVSAPIHEKTLAKLVIKPSMVPELESGGTISLIAEQFICQICSNLIVANFDFGRFGVKLGSVRVPECRNCERMACYMCWYDHLTQTDAKCPTCNDVIEIENK